MQDLHGSIKYVAAVIPQTATNSDTAITGAIIDLQGARGCEFVIVTGAITDANVTVAVTLAESADSGMSGSNAVAASDQSGSPSFDYTSDSTTKKVAYLGTKRYVQMTLTPTGNNSGALPVAAVAALWMMKGP
jgi:hypothetical protein